MAVDNLIKVIQRRGSLNAGVSLGFRGLSHRNETSGDWQGFDIDIARAVAAGVLGDSRAINYFPLQSGDRFDALNNGLIDIGTYNSSITFSREVAHGVKFVQPILFDGEALLTSRKNLRQAVLEMNCHSLKNRVIAAMRGSTTQENLLRFFKSKNLTCEIVQFDSPAEARQAYEDGRCDVYCLDYYLLAGEKSLLSQPDQHVILNDVVSREAMSPAVSGHDSQWVAAVSWIIRTLIEAEELGISSDNVNTLNVPEESYIRQFLYPKKELCAMLGLPENFTRTVIAQVGNYAQIFDRNLGVNSAMNLQRRENKLRSNGGLLYSPLFI